MVDVQWQNSQRPASQYAGISTKLDTTDIQ
jgi:hypothetical protein